MNENSSTDVATAIDQAEKEPLLEKARRFLFGDDVFVSYSRANSTYALALASELTNRKLSCFLDQWGTPPGEELPEKLINTIKKCSTMVLIGSRNAALSENVELEVIEFLKTGRPLIPVTFIADDLILDAPDDLNFQDLIGTLEHATWYPRIKGIAKTIEISSALKTRKPSENVVLRIFNATKFWSRDRRLRKYFAGTLGAILALLVSGIIVAFLLIDKAQEKVAAAEMNANVAVQKQTAAETNANVAVQKQTAAERSAGKARADQLVAETSAKTAIEQQKKAEENLSNTQLELATTGKNLNDAKHQLRGAQDDLTDANIKIVKADEDLKIANQDIQRQTENGRQLAYATDMQLAARLNNVGQVSQMLDTLNNPGYADLKGFEWNYLSHLADGLIPFGKDVDHISEQLLFSPDDKYLLSIGVSTRKSNLSASDLRTGENVTEQIFNAETLESLSFTSEGSPGNIAFSKNGTYFAACIGGKVFLWDTMGTPWKEVPVNLGGAPPKALKTWQFRYEKAIFQTDPLIDNKFISFSEDGGELFIAAAIENDWFLRRYRIADGHEILPAISLAQEFGRDVTDISVKGFAFADCFYVRYKKNGEVRNASYNYSTGIRELPDIPDPSSEVITFSADGGLVAVAAQRPTRKEISIQLTPQRGFESLGYTGTSSKWRKLAVSSDKSRIAALDDAEIKIWELASGKMLRRIPRRSSLGGSIAFSSSGSEIALSEFDDVEGQCLFSLWSVRSPADIFTFSDEKPLAVATDGSRVVTISRSREIKVWDTFSNIPTILTTAHSDNPDDVHVVFSPTNKHIAVFLLDETGSGLHDYTTTLRVWDENNKLITPSTTCQFTATTAFTSDGAGLINLCQDNTLRVFDVRNGFESHSLNTAVGDRRTIRRTIKAAYGLIIYTAHRLTMSDQDEFAAAWDLNTGELMPDTLCNEDIIRYSPNGKWVITVDRKTHEYHLRSDDSRGCESEPLESDDAGFYDINFSDDSSFLAGYYTSTQGHSSLVKYVLKDLSGPTIADTQQQPAGGLLDSSLWGRVKFSPSGRWVLLGNRLFDQQTGDTSNIVGCVDDPAFFEVTSDNLGRLITKCKDGTLKFWSLGSGQEVLSLEAHTTPVKKALLLKENTFLLSSSESEVKLWKTQF